MEIREMFTPASKRRKNMSRSSRAIAKIADSSAELSGEFKSFVSDVEDMIKKSTALEGKELENAKKAIEARVSQARTILDDQSSNIADQARQGVRHANEYVRENPWRSAGATLALGVLCGLLLYKRK